MNELNQDLYRHHKDILWNYWLLIILGGWMVLFPLTFSYGAAMVEPAGGRDIWLTADARVIAMALSDMISGLLLMLFGWRALRPNRPVSVWICCLVGVWLNLAPILFWAPNAVAYVNSTIIGVLAITFSVIIPDIPNITHFKKPGTSIPSAWSYNPSSLPQRSVMMFLAFCGWVISRYLGAYQLGYTEVAWDPFFGQGTREVLESDLSESWPVSDGAFGGFAYTMEFLLVWLGGSLRWRVMPWTVIFFGILVIPLGLVHIFLVISQPVTVGAWCTLCLLAAAIMMPMIALAVDEVAATLQHLVQSVRNGASFGQVFWKGGDPEKRQTGEQIPEMIDFPNQPGRVLQAACRGMSFSVTLSLAAVLGAWLVIAPDIFGVGIEATAAGINHLAGALIVVVSVISMAEVIRGARYANILPALIVAVAPWFAPDGSQELYLNGAVTGMFIILLSIPKGYIHETYGMWDKYIR
ncbi:MAG: vitamin K epoxide reductase family protein [Balneolales bacterium]